MDVTVECYPRWAGLRRVLSPRVWMGFFPISLVVEEISDVVVGEVVELPVI